MNEVRCIYIGINKKIVARKQDNFQPMNKAGLN